MESKKEIYDLIPAELYPATLFFKANTPVENVLKEIEQSELKFPVVGKPDIGMKGMMVKKLENINDLQEYALNSKVDFLIQGFVSHQNEVGIFYYRYPNEEKGYISGIVKKEFLAVV